jgi:formylglycine-generating enzyme required for sulfatase activity
MGYDEAQVEHVCSLVPFYSDTCPPRFLTWYTTTTTAHEVTLPQDFWMDVYEVTNIQYQQCVDAGVCPRPEEFVREDFSYEEYYGNPRFDNYPVAAVSGQDAEIYCSVWREGRLPTEAEWEYAARGTDGRLWPWGDDDPISGYGQFIHIEPVWGYQGQSGEIGLYPKGVSPFGIYDMAGNVGEWVADWFEPYTAEPVVDPTGPEDGTERVARGGDFLSEPPEVSPALRFPVPVGHTIEHSKFFGFRCASDPSL